MKQTYFDYHFKPNLKLDDFFIGKSNFKAFEIIIKNKIKNINNIFLIGPKKCGKSHLGLIWKDKFNAMDYDNNLNHVILTKSNVFIDDIFENINEEDIFHIINHCKINNLKILITSNISLNDFQFKLKDLSSRLKSFLYVKINLPDDELLTNFMMKLFHDKQIIINNPEVFQYILKRVDRSYEKIFILIHKIDKLLLQKNKQLTIPLIKELIY